MLARPARGSRSRARRLRSVVLLLPLFSLSPAPVAGLSAAATPPVPLPRVPPTATGTPELPGTVSLSMSSEEVGALGPTWTLTTCCSTGTGGARVALLLPTAIGGFPAFGVPTTLPASEALVDGTTSKQVEVLRVVAAKPGAAALASSTVLSVPGLSLPKGSGAWKAIVLASSGGGTGKSVTVTLSGMTGLRNPPRPGVYPVMVALIGEGQPQLAEADVVIVKRPAVPPTRARVLFRSRSLHQEQPEATGPSFSGLTTFSGHAGLPSANEFGQSLSIPYVHCSLGLSEFLSAGNENWDWPMEVQGQLATSAMVGQPTSGNLALFPQSPGSGTSFQVSGGVGVNATIGCPGGSFSAGNTLGFANATSAPAPMPGGTTNLPSQGCPGWGIGVPFTNLGVNIGICPVASLSGSDVGAQLGATGAQVSPSSLALDPSPSSLNVTPSAPQWGLGLSGISYQPSFSAGIDVTVSYNACIPWYLYPFYKCYSGTLYTSPTLYFEQGVTQDVGSPSPASLNFPLTAAKGSSAIALSTSSPLVAGTAATVTAALSPSSLSDGTVSFSANGLPIGSCTPSQGTCQVSWTPGQSGTVQLGASWGGDGSYNGSSTSAWVSVYPSGPEMSVQALPAYLGWVYRCFHTPYGTFCNWVSLGNTSDIAVTVTSSGSPANGSAVSFSSSPSGGSFSPASCTTNSNGQCSVTFSASTSKSASYTVTASGDGTSASTHVGYVAKN